MFEQIHIVGIDCSTDPYKTGIASGKYTDGSLNVLDVMLGSKRDSISQTVFELCKNHTTSLIAIDAPLGGPKKWGIALQIIEQVIKY